MPTARSARSSFCPTDDRSDRRPGRRPAPDRLRAREQERAIEGEDGHGAVRIATGDRWLGAHRCNAEPDQKTVPDGKVERQRCVVKTARERVGKDDPSCRLQSGGRQVFSRCWPTRRYLRASTAARSSGAARPRNDLIERDPTALSAQRQTRRPYRAGWPDQTHAGAGARRFHATTGRISDTWPENSAARRSPLGRCSAVTGRTTRPCRRARARPPTKSPARSRSAGRAPARHRCGASSSMACARSRPGPRSESSA